MGVGEDELYGFILEHVDTVPHLEALLLLWNSRPRVWDTTEMAARLFVNESGAHSILSDLTRHGLVIAQADTPVRYLYLSSPENDRLIEAVAYAYRTDLIRISTTIHSKASSGVREFARAFRFKRKGKTP